MRRPLTSLMMAAGLLAAGPAMATLYTSTDVPKAIPDRSIDGYDGRAVSTLTVTDSFTIADVDAILDSLTHTWVSDLAIYLNHGGTYFDNPNSNTYGFIGGTTVLLSSVNGGGGDNYTGTTFDDEAPNSIIVASAPFTGSFTPEGALSDFDGLNAAGVWTLLIADLARQDVGTLNNWSLNITAKACPDPLNPNCVTNPPNPPHPAPEPATLALLGLGLLGLGALRRRT